MTLDLDWFAVCLGVSDKCRESAQSSQCSFNYILRKYCAHKICIYGIGYCNLAFSARLAADKMPFFTPHVQKNKSKKCGMCGSLLHNTDCGCLTWCVQVMRTRRGNTKNRQVGIEMLFQLRFNFRIKTRMCAFKSYLSKWYLCMHTTQILFCARTSKSVKKFQVSSPVLHWKSELL